MMSTANFRQSEREATYARRVAGNIGKRSDPSRDPVSVYAKRRIDEWLALPDDADGKHTQERLAEAAGLSGSTINAIRTMAKRVGPDSGPGLATAFDMSYGDFIAQAEKEPLPEPSSLAEPSAPESYGGDRYHEMWLVRRAATSDGIPADFVAAFEAKFDLDGQPTFSIIYDLLKAAWAAERGKRRGNPPKPDEF
jgi:transcriptional regulator with XRE-family HTH domain